MESLLKTRTRDRVIAPCSARLMISATQGCRTLSESVNAIGEAASKGGIATIVRQRDRDHRVIVGSCLMIVALPDSRLNW